jgi:hypothetical protein
LIRGRNGDKCHAKGKERDKKKRQGAYRRERKERDNEGAAEKAKNNNNYLGNTMDDSEKLEGTSIIREWAMRI